MIARIWHGVTLAVKADDYLRFLLARAVPEYSATPGNRGAYVLRRFSGDRAHFVTLTFWDSREAIAAFAGGEIDRAKYYDEDRDFLLEMEPTVEHFEAEGPEPAPA